MLKGVKQKMNLEEEAFNTLNYLFDKPSHNGNKKVELDTKAKPVTCLTVVKQPYSDSSLSSF